MGREGRQLGILYDDHHYCILNCTLYIYGIFKSYCIAIGKDCVVRLIQEIIIIIMTINESTGISIFLCFFIRKNIDFFFSFETKLCRKDKGKILDIFLIIVLNSFTSYKMFCFNTSHGKYGMTLQMALL